MHEKRFDGTVERLRSPERVARLEVGRVVSLCLEDLDLKTVLDVGVGSGLFAEAFSQRRLIVSGVDVNPEMIVAARKFVPLEWPYQDGEFSPPLAHRLNPTEIADLAQQAGFTHLESIPLTHLAFYRLQI